jgi:hypothetical protein
MPSNIRTLSSQMQHNAAIRANSFIRSHLTPSAQEGEHTPLLPACSEYSQESDTFEAMPDLIDGKYTADLLRPEQQKTFDQEHEDRMKDLASKQLLEDAEIRAQGVRVQHDARMPVPQIIPFVPPNLAYHVVQVHQPLSNVAVSQKISTCFASDDSNGSHPPAMYEQQTGVIREYIIQANRSEDESNGSGSRSSSLQRRGAMRRRTNPISARKSDDECEDDVSGPNSSSLRRCGAVPHKQNPVFVHETRDDFDHF